MRARFALLLLLGITFLASVSVSLEEKPSRLHKCLQSCESEKDPYKRQVCQDRCRLDPEREEHHDQEREEGGEEEEYPRPRPRDEERGRRERGRQEGEKAEEEREQEWRGRQRREDPEERERVRQREEQKRREKEMEKKKQRQEEEKQHRTEKKDQRRERQQDQSSDSQTHNNPFHFTSNSFRTIFKNQHAHIRVLQWFDKRSRQLQNLRDYAIKEFNFKPNSLLLPHHADADFFLVLLSGRAIVTFVKPDDRDSYNLERGDAQRIPAGTTFYLLNPDDRENLRIVSLAIPVNNPPRFKSFFLSSTEDQQSYLEGFSKNILEASFDTEFEEINRVLFGEENKGEQRQEKGIVVKVSKEHIRELTRNAKSSSGRITSSKDEPFNLRSHGPIYSNNFGKQFEITPEKNPQLKDLDIFLSSVVINQGALMLPHYNSKATVILVIDNGEANIELVGLRQEQQRQQEEQEGPREVQRYKAEVSEDDVFTIPSSYPVVVNATSNLSFIAFGINAENNQRYFLAGEKDNVMRKLHRPVKDLAFPGSAEDIDKLIQNQRKSYFVDAQPQQEQEERKGPLSSILNAF